MLCSPFHTLELCLILPNKSWLSQILFSELQRHLCLANTEGLAPVMCYAKYHSYKDGQMGRLDKIDRFLSYLVVQGLRG